MNHLQEHDLIKSDVILTGDESSLANQIHELFPLLNREQFNILRTNNGRLKIVETNVSVLLLM